MGNGDVNGHISADGKDGNYFYHEYEMECNK